MKRPCKFKRRDYKDGRFVLSEEIDGQFHQWGSHYEEFDNGACQITLGVVEDLTGQVDMIPPENIRFTNTEKQNLLNPLPIDYQLDN